MTRAEMLEKAKSIVTGEREGQYGSPEDNFKVITQYWSIYLWGKYGEDFSESLTARDVADMMMLFKIGRLTTGSGTADSYIDIAGYAACGAELLGSEWLRG